MLSGKGNKNGEKTIGLLNYQKNKFACASHFFVHFFAAVLHNNKMKLPENSYM